MTLKLKYNNRRFTIIELIMVMVASAVLLLPITAMIVPVIQEWDKNRNIKLLQEDVDLAAFSVKGIIEEAEGYEFENSSHVVLNFVGDIPDIEIKKAGDALRIDDHDVFEHLDELEFTANEDILNVTITGKRDGRMQKNEFSVKLRNYKHNGD